MATSRASGYVVTASVWNAVLSRLTDDGVTFSGNFNGGSVAGTTGTFSSTLGVTGATTLSSTLAVTGAATFSSTIKERGRTTPIGEWIAVTYSGGDYSDWTVDSGDVSTNRYTLVGKTLIWTLQIFTSTPAAGKAVIKAKIPGGFSAAYSLTAPVAWANESGTVVSAYATVDTGVDATLLNFYKADGTNWSSTANGLGLHIQVVIETT